MGCILSEIEPNQLALLASLTAIAISEDLTPDEIFALAGFIVAVGDTMVAIGAQRELLGAKPGEI